MELKNGEGTSDNNRYFLTLKITKCNDDDGGKIKRNEKYIRRK